jgi:hypothetical protein
MYLGTGDIIATIIALLGALTVMGLAIKENISTQQTERMATPTQYANSRQNRWST